MTSSKRWTTKTVKRKRYLLMNLFTAATECGFMDDKTIAAATGLNVEKISKWRVGTHLPKCDDEVQAAIELLREARVGGPVPKAEVPAPAPPAPASTGDEYEVDAIIQASLALEELSPAARGRVLAFLNSKYGVR